MKKGEVPEQWKADAASKLIVDYTVTDPSVHDSQELLKLVGEDCLGESLFADSAYAGSDIAVRLSELGFDNFIHERAHKNRPLGEISKEANTIKSTVRCLVEHIFGYREDSMNGPEQLICARLTMTSLRERLATASENLKD